MHNDIEAQFRLDCQRELRVESFKTTIQNGNATVGALFNISGILALALLLLAGNFAMCGFFDAAMRLMTPALCSFFGCIMSGLAWATAYLAQSCFLQEDNRAGCAWQKVTMGFVATGYAFTISIAVPLYRVFASLAG